MKNVFFVCSLVLLIIAAVITSVEVFKDYRDRKWDGVNRFTLVVLDKKNSGLQLLSIDPEMKEPIRITLPPDLEINTISGRGVWQIKSMAALAEKFGAVWAADSVSNFLGIPYTAVKDKLGIWDKIGWWNLSRNVRWQDISLTDTPLISESLAPDGVKVLGLTSWWQDKAGDLFYSSNLAKEELKVEVYNTTDVTGLAARAAQIMDNAGVNVTVVDQSDKKVSRCLVNSPPGTGNDRGIMWIVRNFNCDWMGLPGMNNKEVKIFMGNDYAKWVNGG